MLDSGRNPASLEVAGLLVLGVEGARVHRHRDLWRYAARGHALSAAIERG